VAPSVRQYCPMEARPTVFISYSHQDKSWKDRLVQHLKVLEKQGTLEVWDSGRIGAGENWRKEIEFAIGRARVAVLLVSADFLASDFVLREEVPRLLGRRQAEGLRIIPVLVRPCLWHSVFWLAEMQLYPSDGRALSAGAEHVIEEDLAALSAEVLLVATVGATDIKTRPRAGKPAATRLTAGEQTGPIRAEPLSAQQAPKTGSALGLFVSVALGSLGVVCVCMPSSNEPATIDGKISEANSRNAKLDRLLNNPSALDDPSGSASAVPGPSGLPPALHIPTGPTASNDAAPSNNFPALTYDGTVYDTSARRAVSGARVTLLGTSCEALTDNAGAFDFARCDRTIISRIQQPKVTVYLPDGKICVDVPLERPPAANGILVDSLGCSRGVRGKSILYQLFYE
jgi:hypothetical protein